MAKLHVLSDDGEDDDLPELSVLMQQVTLKKKDRKAVPSGKRGKGKELEEKEKEKENQKPGVTNGDSDSDHVLWRVRKTATRPSSVTKPKTIDNVKIDGMEGSLRKSKSEIVAFEISPRSDKQSPIKKTHPGRRQPFETPSHQDNGVVRREDDQKRGDRQWAIEDISRIPIVPCPSRKQRHLGTLEVNSFLLPLYDGPRRSEKGGRKDIWQTSSVNPEKTQPKHVTKDTVDYHAFTTDLRNVLSCESHHSSRGSMPPTEIPRSKFSSNAVNDSSSDSDVFVRTRRRSQNLKFTRIEDSLKPQRKTRSLTKRGRLPRKEEPLPTDMDLGILMPPPQRQNVSQSSSFEEPYLTSSRLSSFIHELESEDSAVDAQAKSVKRRKRSSRAPPNTKLDRLYRQVESIDHSESANDNNDGDLPASNHKKKVLPSAPTSGIDNDAKQSTFLGRALDLSALEALAKDFEDGIERKLHQPTIPTIVQTPVPTPTVPNGSPTKKEPKTLDVKKVFNKQKANLATAFVKEVDHKLTGGKITEALAHTGGIRIEWSKTLLKTAGLAEYRRATQDLTNKDGEVLSVGTYFGKITLADKIITDTYRLHNTIVHEFCHLANFILSGVSKGHGASFKAWGRKASIAFSHLKVEVKTFHSYEIEYKYGWECVSCKQMYYRHSQSIDVSKNACGECKGKLVQIKPDVKAIIEGSYEEFVKKRFAQMKGLKGADGKAMRLIEKMKIIGAEWKQTKAKKEAATNNPLHLHPTDSTAIKYPIQQNSAADFTTGNSKSAPINLADDSGVDLADDDDDDHQAERGGEWDDEGLDHWNEEADGHEDDVVRKLDTLWGCDGRVRG